MRRTLIAVCLIMGALAHTAWAQQKARTVTGTVTDAETGDPVANATVEVVETGASVSADADGKFTVQVSGQVTLRVSGQDYDDQTVVVAPKAVTAAVTLARAVVQTRVVTGLVEAADSGEALSGAQVSIAGTNLSAVTDASGFFVLLGVPMDAVTIQVAAQGATAAEVSVPGTTNSVRVRLERPSAEPPPPPEPESPTTRSIAGRVLEKGTNQPIPGAAIQVVGTDTVVLADADGSFTIPEASVEPVTLEITSGGYSGATTLVLPATAAVTISLDLAQSETIIVTGRAPAIVRENLANGASVVQGDDLNSVTSDNLESGMQGKITGANIQQNGGAPGGGIQISLRGVSTINGRNTPLYVIDGVLVQNVAVSNGLNAITGAAAGSNASNQDNPVNRIADLDPNDIASIEVLKGASAAALYGSKASNGVVIITTKRGRAGKPKVSITQRVGFSQSANRLGFREFGSIEEAQDAFGGAVTPENFSSTPFDHEKELFGETDLAHETVASMSGGNTDQSYAASLLVRDTPGLMKNTGYQKQSGRLALEQRFGKKLTLGLSSNFIHSNTQRGISNNDNTFTTPYFVLGGTPTFFDIRPNSRGEFLTPNPFVPSGTNPLQTAALMTNDLNDEEVYRIITAFNLNYNIYSDANHSLALSGVFGLDFFNYGATIFAPPEAFFEDADGLLGTSVNTDSESENYNVGASLRYGYTPTSGAFKSSTSLGFTYEDRRLDTVLIISQNQNAGQPNVDQGSQSFLDQTRTLERDVGFYLQEEFQVLDESLSLIGAVLVEGNSNNGSGDDFFVYPKVGAVYSVPGLPKDFNSVRARIAYGEAGNQPNFPSRFTPLAADVNLEGSPALTQGLQVGDPNITPERQREIDMGVDLVAFDSRLVVELGGYYKAISDMLLNRQLGGSAGFNTQQFNGGELRNVGVEAMVQVEPVKTSHWTWLSRTLFTFNRSKVTDLPVPAFDAGGFGVGLGAFRIEEGQSATQIVGNVPVDMDGDGVFESSEVRKIGDAEPDFRMTFVNNVAFETSRNGTFGLGSLFDWQQGSEVINLSQFIVDIFRNDDDFRDDNIGDGAPCSVSVANGNSLDEIGAACGEGERRRESGPVNGSDSREYVQTASFLRIREIKVFWSLPDRFVKHLGPAEAVQVSASARNLFTITNYPGLDPEVSNFGNQPIARNIDVAPYPPSRLFWFSVSADF